MTHHEKIRKRIRQTILIHNKRKTQTKQIKAKVKAKSREKKTECRVESVSNEKGNGDANHWEI